MSSRCYRLAYRSEERDVYAGILGRNRAAIFYQLRPGSPWHIGTGSSQLSQVLLSAIQYVLQITYPDSLTYLDHK